MSYFLFIIFHIEMSTLKVSKKYTYTHFTDIFCFIFIHGTTIKYNIIFDIKEWHIRDTLFFCTDLVVSYMYIRMDQLCIWKNWYCGIRTRFSCFLIEHPSIFFLKINFICYSFLYELMKITLHLLVVLKLGFLFDFDWPKLNFKVNLIWYSFLYYCKIYFNYDMLFCFFIDFN